MNCEHDVDKNVIITRNTKILHKIHARMKTLIKSTEKEINHNNFNMILIKVMRELNKHGLYGFEKQKLAVEIMTLLLDELSPAPHIVNHYTVELIVEMIEIVYTHGFHRYKRVKKCCVM